MQATTWKDKVVDPSNLWLSATRSEDDGRLAEAIVYYLNDASECLRRGLRARAALSCSCAASCLERTGNTNASRHLYIESAKMYEEQAKASFGTSIREALWSLQDAHDYYVMGGDSHKAGQIYDECASLAMKLSPFLARDNLDQVLRIRRSSEARPVTVSVPVPQTSDVSNAIDGFIRLRDGNISPLGPQAKATTDRARRRPSIEKSIVS